MVQFFQQSRTYTIADLNTLCDRYIPNKPIQTKRQTSLSYHSLSKIEPISTSDRYQFFLLEFNLILNFLVTNEDLRDEDSLKEQFFAVFSKEVRDLVIRKLAQADKLQIKPDGSYRLPGLKVLRDEVGLEMNTRGVMQKLEQLLEMKKKGQDDLSKLFNRFTDQNRISSPNSYYLFVNEFDRIVHSLVANEDLDDENILVDRFYAVLSKEVRDQVVRQLVQKNEMKKKPDGTYRLPSLKVLRKEVDSEINTRKSIISIETSVENSVGPLS